MGGTRTSRARAALATDGARAMPAGDRGEPLLVWPGKVALVIPDGASLTTLDVVEGASGAGLPVGSGAMPDNRLIWGDNLQAMAALLSECPGKIALIYVDPPFATGATYVQKVRVGGSTAGGPARLIRETAYRDAWGAGRAAYLQMLYERFTLMHALLAEGGAIYVHVDPTVAHYVRLLLDEVFGAAGFQREIVWRIGWVSGYKSAAANWVRNHDTILYYTKGPAAVFNKEYLAYPPGYRRRGSGEARGRGYPVEDVWNASPAEQALTGGESLDSIQIKSFSTEKTGFPTQKNESLLRRIVAASSRPGDLVADFFCGSGTTLAVAGALGRRWIGCDEGWRAIHTTRKRLLENPAGPSFMVERCDSGHGGVVQLGRRRRASTVGPARAEFTLDVSGGAAQVSLIGYTPSEGRAGQVASPVDHWSAYVDYWAVDYAHEGMIFRDEWRSFRGRENGRLALTSPLHRCSGTGRWVVAAKVIDVFGDESLSAWEIAFP